MAIALLRLSLTAVSAVGGAGLTLLFYVVLHCMQTKPSALDFPKEFEPVGKAFAYPLDALTGDVAKIIKDVKGLEKFAKEAKECKDPADKWAERVDDFSKRMSASVAVLGKFIARLGEMSKTMCVQLAETPDERALDDIFRKLFSFAGMFQAGADFLNEEEAKRKAEVQKKQDAKAFSSLDPKLRKLKARCAKGPIPPEEAANLVEWLFTAEGRALSAFPDKQETFMRLVVGGAGVAALDINDPQAHGHTALLRALHAQRLPLFKLMLKLGANPRAKDDDGKDCQDLVANIKDDQVRKELAALCKIAKEEYGCFRMVGERGGKETLYIFEEDMLVHTSKTCAVCRVIDLKTQKKLVLKFMHEREQYETEIAMRQNDPPALHWDPACLATCLGASLEDGNRTLKGGSNNYMPMLANTEFSSGRHSWNVRGTEWRLAVTGIALFEVDPGSPVGKMDTARMFGRGGQGGWGDFQRDIRVKNDSVLTLTLDITAGTFEVAVDGEPKPELTFSEGIAGKAWIPVAGCNDYESSVTIVGELKSEVHPLESQLSAKCVVQIRDCCVLAEGNLERQADICRKRTAKANAIRHFGRHLLVMERGERDLADIVAHDLVAGVDKGQVVQMGRSIAECLLKLEDINRIHGDVKPRNAMEFREPLASMFGSVSEWLQDIGMEEMLAAFDGMAMLEVMEMDAEAAEAHVQAAEARNLTNVYKMRTDLEQKTRPVITMIDLDASANHGDPSGLKWSSAYSPPELARLIHDHAKLPSRTRPAWDDYVRSHGEQVSAAVSFDVSSCLERQVAICDSGTLKCSLVHRRCGRSA
eukprot:COSAG04_NODE_1562_length_6335_cov_34.922226_4_plen_815_part_00